MTAQVVTVPKWKQTLLEKKRASTDATTRKDPWANIPTWKRELLQRKHQQKNSIVFLPQTQSSDEHLLPVHDNPWVVGDPCPRVGEGKRREDDDEKLQNEGEEIAYGRGFVHRLLQKFSNLAEVDKTRAPHHDISRHSDASSPRSPRTSVTSWGDVSPRIHQDIYYNEIDRTPRQHTEDQALVHNDKTSPCEKATSPRSDEAKFPFSPCNDESIFPQSEDVVSPKSSPRGTSPKLSNHVLSDLPSVNATVNGDLSHDEKAVIEEQVVSVAIAKSMFEKRGGGKPLVPLKPVALKPKESDKKGKADSPDGKVLESNKSNSIGIVENGEQVLNVKAEPTKQMKWGHVSNNNVISQQNSEVNKNVVTKNHNTYKSNDNEMPVEIPRPSTTSQNKIFKKLPHSGPGELVIRPASNLLTQGMVVTPKYNDIRSGTFAAPTKRPEYYSDSDSDTETFEYVNIEFINSNVRLERSLLQKTKAPQKLRLSFTDAGPSIYEYPSEQYLLDSLPPQPGDFDHPDTIHPEEEAEDERNGDISEPPQPIGILSDYRGKVQVSYELGKSTDIAQTKVKGPNTSHSSKKQVSKADEQDTSWSQTGGTDLLF